MKLMFVSDIHGDEVCAEAVFNKFFEEKADKLVICGDVLYHGPRNDLPKGYKPKGVANILNKISDKIISVRGNCDSEVDQMMLEFPVMSDYALISVDGVNIYVTHGHIYSPENPLKLQKGDVLVSGHTHILDITKKTGMLFLNPGSVSIPKQNNPKTYMIYENKEFTIKTFDDEIIKSVNL